MGSKKIETRIEYVAIQPPATFLISHDCPEDAKTFGDLYEDYPECFYANEKNKINIKKIGKFYTELGEQDDISDMVIQRIKAGLRLSKRGQQAD